MGIPLAADAASSTLPPLLLSPLSTYTSQASLGLQMTNELETRCVSTGRLQQQESVDIDKSEYIRM